MSEIATKRVSVLIVLFILASWIPPAFAQEQQPNAQTFIGYAENEINNFGYWSKQYWFNLSQSVLYDSFVDIANARSDVGIATSYLSTNTTLALPFAAEASFAAKRANYRIFLYLTYQVVEDTNRTFYSIPDYIPKPPDVNALLTKAIRIYESDNFSYFLGPYSYPSVADTWSTLNQLELSIEQLWSNVDSAASLAHQAKAEVIAYLAQQEPVYRRQIALELNGLKSKFSLFSPISPVISVILAVSAIAPLASMLFGWVREIFEVEWDGDLFRGRRFRRLVGSLIIASATLMVAGSTYLLSLLSDLSGAASSYDLVLSTSLVLAAQIALYLAIFLAVGCIVSSILNAGLERHRCLTGISAIAAMMLAILSWIIAWVISYSALSLLAV